MCGFTGFLRPRGFASEDAKSIITKMSERLVHRGPDDVGLWVDPQSGVALAHRRLSIVDLSSAGHQPMTSASGRWVIAYNGEIYNHMELRRNIEGGQQPISWRGHSDTETLLTGFDTWGIRSTIERCVGMFAFAVWDKKERTLHLGRDRMGEKPVYYGWQGVGEQSGFLFGSELKALRVYPGFEAEVDRNALSLYMRHNYVPAPYSIFEKVFKLKPGHLLSINANNQEPIIEEYWSMSDLAMRGSRSSRQINHYELKEQLEAHLNVAVKSQMMADVPIGAFLSGGVDSSTIVALMQSHSSSPVKTFTIGFHEESYDEAKYAKAVAQHLGTDHTELYVTAQEAMACIPNLSEVYCEPFADSSQIPTLLVSQLARQHVTVSLSGDAGDELFGGYNRYVMAKKLWGTISKVPQPLRSLTASGLTTLSPEFWDGIGRMLPGIRNIPNAGDAVHKGAKALSVRSLDELYLKLVTHWDPEEVVINGQEPNTPLRGDTPTMDGLDSIQRMMLLDSITYLPDDILTKVDRAAMASSLESRVPFLDHRLIEFVWRIPQSMKLQGGIGKWILREVLYRHVPKALIERPKMGFGVPIGAWLRGPLRGWAEELLDERRLQQEGYLKAEPIRRKWSEHLSGKRNWQYPLWDIIMFQQWLHSRNGNLH